MGTIMNNRTLIPQEILKFPLPIILCIDRPDINYAITDAGYQTVSLNLLLARSLKGLTEDFIRSSIGDIIREILPHEKPVFLTDYEMLFDPRYNLDVIKLFVYISRRNKLIAKWCGTIEDNLLVYAEPDFLDYKKYKIDDYDITAIY